jgi:putative sigma-54 modulation protein
MECIIRGENLQLTEALKEYVEKKLSRLERYFDTSFSSNVHVTLSVVRELHNVEVTIPMIGSGVLRAEDRSDDMYASIDQVLDKLERQIRKLKTKLNRKIRVNAERKAIFQDTVFEAQQVAVEIDDAEEPYELVRTKSFNMKPMDVEEAILQMNMVGHNFFVFSNSENSKINVVYRRNDGKYGLIEPK